MAITEKIQLLGKGLYESIPDELTLKTIPTGSELDYVGAEDFDETMLTKILPQCIEESIDTKQLLEIDYQWILRCLRIMNYGPYVTVNSIFCQQCNSVSHGEYIVNIQTVPCTPIPEGFVNDITISKDEFLEFNQDISLRLPTIQSVLNSRKDKQFQDAFGNTNRQFARMCYMIHKIGGQTMDPVAIRMKLQKDMSSADYIILQDALVRTSNYGLRSGGRTVCPKCKSDDAAFVSFIDERFFRPTVAVLRRWREDRNRGKMENVLRAQAGKVQSRTR